MQVPSTSGEFPSPAHVECDAELRRCDINPPPPPPPPPPPDGGVPRCAVPVPGNVTISGPVWGEYNVAFYIPHLSWAFATAHAWKLLAEMQGITLPLRPAFFFATALKESYLGCSDILPEPDPFKPGQLFRRSASYHDGCFQIESLTAWTELCRMFPEDFDCAKVTHADVVSSERQAQTGRDNFATSALIKAYYDALSYSMIPGKHNVPDPAAWFAGARDPLAREKVIAVLYNKGQWAPDVTAILANCRNDLIENCMQWAKDYPIQVGQYTRELEAAVSVGNCFDGPITQADTEDYVHRIALVFRNADETAARSAAGAAFAALARGRTSIGFQEAALPILAAIQQHIPSRPHCPAKELAEYYKLSCP